MRSVSGRPDVTLAWVESPFQLLGALEAHAAGQLTRALDVLPRTGIEPLRRTIAELQRLGLPPGVTIRPPSRAPHRVTGHLAVGDAFSGAVHLLLLASRPQSVVLLDDGRSTRRVMDALVRTGHPLARPHVPSSTPRAWLARAALIRLHRLARRGRLRVVTAMDLPPTVLDGAERAGVPVSRHAFAWLRSLPGDEAGPPAGAAAGDVPTVVLGTSMVATRLISAKPYLDWIRALAAQGPVTYRPHRRENASTLGPLAQVPGLTIERGEVPVEISLRGLTAQQRLVTLPSTAVSTLRLVVPDARIQEFAVPEGWWLPGVPAAARAHLVPDGASLSPLTSISPISPIDVPAESADPAAHS